MATCDATAGIQACGRNVPRCTFQTTLRRPTAGAGLRRVHEVARAQPGQHPGPPACLLHNAEIAERVDGLTRGRFFCGKGGYTRPVTPL